jgi:hypothetical protein
MADEATIQETTTENAVTETVDTTATVDSTTDIGADVQGTETDIVVTDSVDTDKSTKTYDESYVRKLRDENAATRVKAKDAEKAAQAAARQAQEASDAQKSLTERLGRALGFVEDAPLAPEELLKQASAREAQLSAERDTVATELRTLRIEKALNAAAEKHDGDTSILAPYLTGTGALAQLDPTADDFSSQVEAIVENAVTTNPKLKKAVQVAAPRSGGDLSSGNGSTKPTGEKSIDDLRREKRERDQKKREWS